MTSPDSVDILCATSQYQVCLRTLAPQATDYLALATTELSVGLSDPQNRVHTFWLLSGTLKIYESNTAIKTLEARQSLEIDHSGSVPEIRIVNETNEPALCLEIWRGIFQPQPPLAQNAQATENRPWGSYTVLQDTPRYKLKQLAVQPGSRLSLQRHKHREEHWMILAGSPCITLDNKTFQLEAGGAICIPTHSWHRIANPLPEPIPGQETKAPVVEIIELQLGDYFGEDDIERSQDDYGRT